MHDDIVSNVGIGVAPLTARGQPSLSATSNDGVDRGVLDHIGLEGDDAIVGMIVPEAKLNLPE